MNPVTTNTTMTDRRAPALIRASNPLTRRLLGIGVPMGPNVLLTVRGRTSGEPRTAPVAITEVGGRRWVIGAYGDVQWTRNLRVAGEADLSTHGRIEHVLARELSEGEATTWFAATLPSYIARFPWFGRLFARVLFRLVAPEILSDPAGAAATRPVFELAAADARPAD
jgi:deazaflavin-dependent oxidoreductase (nitroreductase family)